MLTHIWILAYKNASSLQHSLHLSVNCDTAEIIFWQSTGTFDILSAENLC